MSEKIIQGFSKLSKLEKIQYLVHYFFANRKKIEEELKSFWHRNEKGQKLFDEFSENTISNFYLPYGVVPNFLVNGKIHCIPMAIEESSVVAACSKTANYWLKRGGFKAKVFSTAKVGQVHFYWNGDTSTLIQTFQSHKADLLMQLKGLTANMEKRGGGIKDIELKDFSKEEKGYYQLFVTYETCDAMGANFINSTLEAMASHWKSILDQKQQGRADIIMAILSNYTPDCLARAELSCPIEQLSGVDQSLSAQKFAQRFFQAVRMANIDPYRAATHNKGIFNGVDALVLATGNDFRAVEACGHAYAARNGTYQGLTHCSLDDGEFRFWIDLPLALGTVGGLTSLHPMAKIGLDLLGRPDARGLMELAASVGLAQNFAAIRSLITSGIQKGHMRMHLVNILNRLEATETEVEKAKEHFKDRVAGYKAVQDFLWSIRNYQ